jgi:hypothetical protein
MRPGWYWINFKAVPEDLDRVGGAQAGEVGERPKLEHRQDPLDGVEVRRVGGQPQHRPAGPAATTAPTAH